MNPLRYFLRSLAFSALRGYRVNPRVLGIVAGRSLGGFLVALLQRR